jgi:hypothetical protein
VLGEIKIRDVNVSGHGGRRAGAGRKPGSRNRTPRDLKAKIRQLADAKIVPTLDRLLDDRDARVRMEAAREVLNRTLGKPREEHHVTGGLSIEAQLHLRALERTSAAVTVEARPMLEAPDPASVSGPEGRGSDDAPEDVSIDTTLTPTSSEVTP